MHYVAWRFPGNTLVFADDSLDRVKAVVANTEGSPQIVWAPAENRPGAAERGVLRTWTAKDYVMQAEFVIEEFDLSEQKAEG